MPTMLVDAPPAPRPMRTRRPRERVLRISLWLVVLLLVIALATTLIQAAMMTSSFPSLTTLTQTPLGEVVNTYPLIAWSVLSTILLLLLLGTLVDRRWSRASVTARPVAKRAFGGQAAAHPVAMAESPSHPVAAPPAAQVAPEPPPVTPQPAVDPYDIKVFLSGTFRELVDYRKTVYEILRNFALSGVGMEQYPARSLSVLDSSLEMTDRADLYLGIFSHRYGVYTRAEYDRAWDRQIPIIIFLPASVTPLNVLDVEVNTARQAEWEAFVQLLYQRHTIGEYHSINDLTKKLQPTLFHEVLRIVQQRYETRLKTGASGQALVAPYELASLPQTATFIGRDQERQQIQGLLHSERIAIIRGIGGIGKSALASEVARDLLPEYPGGIAVINCQNPTQGGLAQAEDLLRTTLGRFGKLPPEGDQQTLATTAHALLQGKPVLIVLDNVEPNWRWVHSSAHCARPEPRC